MDNELLFHDLQDLHGASLDADAAGNALGSGIFGLENHDMHGAGFDALAAADTLLLVDHVNAGLGILSDCIMFAGTHALAALDADIGLGLVALGNDLDAGQCDIKFLVEGFGAGLHTLQTCHTFGTLFNSELLHSRELSFIIIIASLLYIICSQNATHNIDIF